MKKLLISISFLLAAFISFGQGYLIPQNIGSANTLLNTNGGGIKAVLVAYSYPDTTAANFCPCASINYSVVATTAGLWYRYNGQWKLIGTGGGSGGGFTSVLINSDSTKYIYYVNATPTDSVSTLLLTVIGQKGVTITKSNDTAFFSGTTVDSLRKGSDSLTIQALKNGVWINQMILNSGGGGSQTYQQTLTQGSTLTQANTINNGGFKQISSNGKNVFDSIAVNVSNYFLDSMFFSGTSITYGMGPTSAGNRFTTLVSEALSSVEINHGCSGCSMTIQGINSTNLGFIPTYRNTQRWMVLEWGVNDMHLNVTDTATYVAAYLRYIDTAIARGWPVSKILVLSPSYVDPVALPNATPTRQAMFQAATLGISQRRNTLYLDNYSLEVAGGKSLLLIDGIHPSDYGTSLAYVNPIINKLGDLTRSQAQAIAANGVTELNSLKLNGLPYGDEKSVLLGQDTVGNTIRFNRASYIANAYTAVEGQGSKIWTKGDIKTDSAILAGYGRFAGAVPSGLTGSSLEFSLVSGNQSYITSYNRSANTPLPLSINAFGGRIGLGGAAAAAGNSIVQVNGGIEQTWGQFTGAINPSTGAGVEIGNVSTTGYIGAYDRVGNAARDLSLEGLGGNLVIGALAASGTNKLQVTGSGHFTSTLVVGGTTPAASALFDIQATQNKGVLFPHLSTSQQNAISSPATGLLIHNTDSAAIGGLCVYTGSAWRAYMLNNGGGGGSSQWTGTTDIYNTDTTGKVGIGTANPDSPLTVQKGISFKGLFPSTDVTDQMLVVNSSGGVGVRAIGGGTQTPWTSDIDGGNFNLTNVNGITASSFSGDGSGLTGLPVSGISDVLGVNQALSGDKVVDQNGHGYGHTNVLNYSLQGITYTGGLFGISDDGVFWLGDKDGSVNSTYVSGDDGGRTLEYNATNGHTFYGKVKMNNIINLKAYTVAGLPSGTIGDVAYVTDALLPSYLATVVGGGAVKTIVFYDGSSWTAH